MELWLTDFQMENAAKKAQLMQLEFMTDFFLNGFNETNLITSSTKKPPRNVLNDKGADKHTFSYEPEAEDVDDENELDQYDNPSNLVYDFKEIISQRCIQIEITRLMAQNVIIEEWKMV
jgi:hypothetical protein